VSEQIGVIACPTFFHFGQDIGGRCPARHGGSDFCGRAETGQGTAGSIRIVIKPPGDGPAGVTIEWIFPRTGRFNGATNFAKVRAGDGVVVGRPLDGLRAGRKAPEGQNYRQVKLGFVASVHRRVS
jgi:hypothetical protein